MICSIFHSSLYCATSGELAKTTSPEEVGRATGELCSAMAAVKLDAVPPIPPYYDVFRVHHAINRELFYQDAASNPAFEVRRWEGFGVL
jgi:hypothetical protein